MKVFEIISDSEKIKIKEGVDVSYSNEGTRVYLNKKYVPLKLLEKSGNQKRVYNVKVKENNNVLFLEEVSFLKEKNQGNILLFIKATNIDGIICDRSFYRQKILLTDYENNQYGESKNYLVRLKTDTPIRLLKSDYSIFDLSYDARKNTILVKNSDNSKTENFNDDDEDNDFFEDDSLLNDE